MSGPNQIPLITFLIQLALLSLPLLQAENKGSDFAHLFRPSRILKEEGKVEVDFPDPKVINHGQVEVRGIKQLAILGLFDLTMRNKRRLEGESEKFAAELAISDINKMNGLLEGYNLTLHYNDTQCDAGAGVDAFFHALYRKKEHKMISLVGTSSSDITERLAKIVPYWNMVQVSFGSTSQTLSDRNKFPFFYRTVSPVSSHNAAIIQLLHQFNWDTVTFFSKNENQFTMASNFLVTELEKVNVTCKGTLTFSSFDIKDQLQYMKDHLDSRIIIGSFGSDIAPIIFCEVFRLKMFGPDYAWILIGKPEENWWRKQSFAYSNKSFSTKILSTTQSNCGQWELAKAVENTLIVDRHNFAVQNMKTISGYTADSFKAKFKENKKEMSEFAPETYDAIWCLALALDNLKKKYNYDLNLFSYASNSKFSKNFLREMSKLDFNGVSGPISFSGSDRIGITSFTQIQEGRVVRVALYFPRDSILNLSCSDCRSIQWHKNQVPISRREFRFKRVHVETTSYYAVAFIASLGILMAAAFLAFNLYNRKLKYIKLSSPLLNNMVIIGCIFAYLSVILLGSEFGPIPDGKHFAYICTTRAYLLATGFSLAFGAMFTKTYRVHRIFTRSSLEIVKNKLLRDNQLVILVMSLVLTDCFIISLWVVFDPMHRHLLNLTIEIDPEDRSVVYQPQIEVCHSLHGHTWLSVLYGYKSLLLVVGLYMAWETRHVKVQALNDSKYIGLCVYIVVLTSVLGVSLENLLSERVTLSFLTVTALVLVSTTVTLWLLFLPKIHTIMRNPVGGDPIVQSMGLKIEFNTRRFMTEDTWKERVFRAEVQNRVYKRQIESINTELIKMELFLSTDFQEIQQIEELEEGKGRSRTPSVDSSLSGPDESEIYTIYLHGPRFMVPISLFNFDSGVPSTTPRSSWPNEDSPLSPLKNSFGDQRFKSEPKLVSPSEENFPGKDFSANGKVLQKGILPKNPSSSFFLDIIRYPLNYFSGLVRPSVKDNKKKIPEKIFNFEISRHEDFKLKRTKSNIQAIKYNSVPDLCWAIPNSSKMTFHNLELKNKTFNSDTVVDSFKLENSRQTSMEEPTFQLTLTSNEAATHL